MAGYLLCVLHSNLYKIHRSDILLQLIIFGADNARNHQLVMLVRLEIK
jgi:hypothetical protein